MAIEFVFAAYVGQVTAIRNLVGTRITAERLKQTKDMPTSLVYSLSGGQGYLHSQGASGLTRADIEITCHAASYPKARALYDAIRDAIHGFRGVWGETDIDRCVMSEPRSATAPPTQGDQVGFPGLMAEVEIHFQQAVPTLGGS
jgi:hypothetical protein